MNVNARIWTIGACAGICGGALVGFFVPAPSWNQLFLYMVKSALLLLPVGIGTSLAAWHFVKGHVFTNARFLLILAVSMLVATILVTLEVCIIYLVRPDWVYQPVHAFNLIPGSIIGGVVTLQYLTELQRSDRAV